jgi:hypothetical protein
MKKLDTTKRIIVNCVIRVYRKGFGYSKVTIVDNNEYFITALADEEFFDYCRENDIVEAYLWVEDIASYEFTLTVIGKMAPGLRFLFFAHTDMITRNEQRKCLTATVDIPMQFFTFDPGDREKGITTEEIVYHTGSVILLSDREATVRSNVDLREAKFLKGHISIKNELIELVGMIDPINVSKKVYNVIFAGMNERVRNHILEYIFSIYRE